MPVLRSAIRDQARITVDFTRVEAQRIADGLIGRSPLRAIVQESGWLRHLAIVSHCAAEALPLPSLRDGRHGSSAWPHCHGRAMAVLLAGSASW